jgi:hypothetical protein
MWSWRKFLILLTTFLLGIVLPLGAADPAPKAEPGIQRIACNSDIDYSAAGVWGTPNANITCSGLPRWQCFASHL